MKYVMIAFLISTFCLNHNVKAKDTYTSLRDFFVNCGESIEQIDGIPLIGKFTYLLPFAAIVACCKECPGQTMAVIIGLFFCGLSRSESLRSMLSRCNVMWGKNQINPTHLGETLYTAPNSKENEKDTQSEGPSTSDDEYNIFRGIPQSIKQQ